MPKIKVQGVPFSQIANAVLNDRRLSWRAKGLFAYLYSKPDNWDFAVARMVEDGIDGRDVVYKSVKELEGRGYLKRQKLANGRIIYYLSYGEPVTEKAELEPTPEIAKLGNSQVGKTRSISNTDAESNKDAERNKEYITVREDFDAQAYIVSMVENNNETTSTLGAIADEMIEASRLVPWETKKEAQAWIRSNIKWARELQEFGVHKIRLTVQYMATVKINNQPMAFAVSTILRWITKPEVYRQQ